MTNTQKITIHGVEVTQTQLQGKWYTPVDGRVKIAEQADPAKVRRDGAGYHVISVQIMQVGDRWAYHCMVEYPAGSGVVKPGTDFIDLKDAAGIAKAETSAIGRALGLHGIACEESIASAEEVERATEPTGNTATAPHRTPQPHLTAQPQHAPASTSDAPAASQRVSTQDTPRSATKEQRDMLAKGAAAMGRTLELDDALTFDEAEAMLAAWRREWQQMNMHKRPATAAPVDTPDLSTLGNGGGRH